MTEQTCRPGGFDESAKTMKSLEVVWMLCDAGSAESLKKKNTETSRLAVSFWLMFYQSTCLWDAYGADDGADEEDAAPSSDTVDLTDT